MILGIKQICKIFCADCRDWKDEFLTRRKIGSESFGFEGIYGNIVIMRLTSTELWNGEKLPSVSDSIFLMEIS